MTMNCNAWHLPCHAMRHGMHPCIYVEKFELDKEAGSNGWLKFELGKEAGSKGGLKFELKF
jgi:hypothetical protein